MNQSLLLILPEIVIAASGLLLLMFGVYRRTDSTRIVAWLVVCFLLALRLFRWR